MLTTGVRNIILKIVIVLLSLTLLGLQSEPEIVNAAPEMDYGASSIGFVELIIWGEASGGSGASTVKFTWNPVQLTMWINGFDSTGAAKFQGQSFTTASGTARQGPITVQAGWPVHWWVEGTIAPPPDCSINLKIDEIWYPGWSIGCGPLIGCYGDTWPAAAHPGATVYIPWDRAWGLGSSGARAMGMPVHLTVVTYHISVGQDPLGCEFHVNYPVIPQ